MTPIHRKHQQRPAAQLAGQHCQDEAQVTGKSGDPTFRAAKHKQFWLHQDGPPQLQLCLTAALQRRAYSCFEHVLRPQKRGREMDPAPAIQFGTTHPHPLNRSNPPRVHSKHGQTHPSPFKAWSNPAKPTPNPRRTHPKPTATLSPFKTWSHPLQTHVHRRYQAFDPTTAPLHFLDAVRYALAACVASQDLEHFQCLFPTGPPIAMPGSCVWPWNPY